MPPCRPRAESAGRRRPWARVFAPTARRVRAAKPADTAAGRPAGRPAANPRPQHGCEDGGRAAQRRTRYGPRGPPGDVIGTGDAEASPGAGMPRRGAWGGLQAPPESPPEGRRPEDRIGAGGVRGAVPRGGTMARCARRGGGAETCRGDRRGAARVTDAARANVRVQQARLAADRRQLRWRVDSESTQCWRADS